MKGVDTSPRVVIIGGGFGGLYAANALRKAPVQVTLVDRRNFHLFQPLLYQVATGGLSPANIAYPLRSLVKSHKNTTTYLAEVVDFDCENQQVILKDGELPYDKLIVAAGAQNHYFGREGWEPFAPGLKTIEDATLIRRRLLSIFEAAEREPDDKARQQLLTFVVIGGGPTGVELAGALAEVAFSTLKSDFRNFSPSDSKIYLLEGGPRLLSSFPEKLSEKTKKSLELRSARTALSRTFNLRTSSSVKTTTRRPSPRKQFYGERG